VVTAVIVVKVVWACAVITVGRVKLIPDEVKDHDDKPNAPMEPPGSEPLKQSLELLRAQLEVQREQLVTFREQLAAKDTQLAAKEEQLQLALKISHERQKRARSADTVTDDESPNMSARDPDKCALTHFLQNGRLMFHPDFKTPFLDLANEYKVHCAENNIRNFKPLNWRLHADYYAGPFAQHGLSKVTINKRHFVQGCRIVEPPEHVE
jgi:hypothetical protein